MKINNMSQLKKVLKEGAIIETINHQNPELVGLNRQVTKAQTNGIYSIIPEQPEHKYSTCNGGRGSWMEFDKADHYEFGDTIKWFALPIGTDKNYMVMEFVVQ